MAGKTGGGESATMTYHEEKIGKKWYEWHTCEILGCTNIAGHQNASTGSLICNEHFDLIGPEHKSAFVVIDGGKKPREESQ